MVHRANTSSHLIVKQYNIPNQSGQLHVAQGSIEYFVGAAGVKCYAFCGLPWCKHRIWTV